MKISGFYKKAAVVLILAAAVGGGYYYYNSESEEFSFKTADISARDIVSSIDATGTIEPEDLIEIAARVSGEILSFGKDKSGKTVDYGSRVGEGDVLAVIDEEIQRSNLIQAQAQLEQRKSSNAQAKANLELSIAKLRQAERDWKRAESLGVGDALSQSTYDSYLSAWEISKAQLEVDKATISQTDGQIKEAEAALRAEERNLQYCIIKSPVDGVIIDRIVNIGQTVVSSMSASDLFLIAKDLKKMEVWASVNEADIGQIRIGQPVSFTVDAFPGETFKGEVQKLRLNATMSQNVVTYVVEVSTDNSSERLLPYLTANLKFETARENKTLAVPNGALRVVIEEKYVSPLANPEDLEAESKIWKVGEDGLALPVPVETGISDGEYTAIKLPKGANADFAAIIGVQSVSEKSGATSNPFAFKPPARKKSSSGPPM